MQDPPGPHLVVDPMHVGSWNEDRTLRIHEPHSCRETVDPCVHAVGLDRKARVGKGETADREGADLGRKTRSDPERCTNSSPLLSTSRVPTKVPMGELDGQRAEPVGCKRKIRPLTRVVANLQRSPEWAVRSPSCSFESCSASLESVRRLTSRTSRSRCFVISSRCCAAK